MSCVNYYPIKMNGVEGDKNNNQQLDKVLQNKETRSILFAVYSSLSSLQKSSMGYLDELDNSSNCDSEIIKSLKKINRLEERQIYLLEVLSRLMGVKQGRIVALHPEQLFDNISKMHSNIRFSMPKTYKKSIISIDETVFCHSVSAFLTCISKVTNLNLRFRRRERSFVISIYANRLDWIKNDLADIRPSVTIGLGSNIEQLVVIYSINMLHSISVKPYFLHHDGRQSIGLRLPSAGQLNVFDRATST